MGDLLENPRPRQSTQLRLLLRTVRPHQWIKNLACCAGLIFSGRLFLVEMQLRAALAVLAFSATAATVYLFNDYRDRNRDRLNPRTAHRPLASRQLSLAWAGFAFALLLAGSAAAATFLGAACLVVLVGYLALNLGYTLRFKNTVIADVICIALGFVLRVLFGVYAVQVPPTPWIILCMFFLSLFLGFGKRYGELDSLDASAASAAARPVLTKYTIKFLELTIGVTATLTIATYTLYCVAPHHDPTMVATVLPVVYCVLRYAHQILVEGRGQSPERLLYSDKMLWIGILSWLVLSVAVLYGRPHLVAFVESV